MIKKRPSRHAKPTTENVIEQKESIYTLLVDGNALFKTGFMGAKNEFNSKGENIGGIYQFITVLKSLMNETTYHKVFVFWDGPFSGKLRYEIYKPYKHKRKDYTVGTYPEVDFLIQQTRVKEYLEEFYIKQMVDDVVEGDDLIGAYCLTHTDELITICTNDSDMLQLVSDNVRFYDCGPNKKRFVTINNYQMFYDFHIDNALLIKSISGDSSDSIIGIRGIKETTLLNLFPELAKRRVTLEELLEWAETQQKLRLSEKKKPLVALTNLIERNHNGPQGSRIYEVNEVLINLRKPLLTDNVVSELTTLIDNDLSEEDRGLKNVLKMFREDELDKIIGEKNLDNYMLTFKKFIIRKK